MKLWLRDTFLAFSSAIVVEVFSAAVIGTSKIVGEKVKTKLLVERKYCCFDNIINSILYLFDSKKMRYMTD